MESPIFEMQAVTIRYGLRRAVDNLTLSLQPGKALGLLGLNGAGKTSTILALMGMLHPKLGRIKIFDGSPGTVRAFRRTGFAPESAIPPEYLNAQEYLSFVAALRLEERKRRNQEVLELLSWFELPPTKRIKDYSKGMMRRLVLAQAFLGNPELLILDEPLNGLDPIVIIRLRERLEQYRNRGGTVLFSSHILTEVEKTCTDVAILSEGRLNYLGSLEKTLNDFGTVEAAFAAKVSETEA